MASAFKSIRNLDYTVLLCGNLARMRDFYHDILKFEIEVEQDSWVSFRVGSNVLALRSRGKLFNIDDGPSPMGSANVQLAFRVAPHLLEACRKELEEAGVVIQTGPISIDAWRHRALFFTDPECNPIEIYAEV